MAEQNGNFLDGVNAGNILDRGTNILASVLKPKPATTAARPAPAPAPAPAKTNFVPWIIGGAVAVLVIGGLIVAGVFMRPKGTP